MDQPWSGIAQGQLEFGHIWASWPDFDRSRPEFDRSAAKTLTHAASKRGNERKPSPSTAVARLNSISKLFSESK